VNWVILPNAHWNVTSAAATVSYPRFTFCRAAGGLRIGAAAENVLIPLRAFRERVAREGAFRRLSIHPRRGSGGSPPPPGDWRSATQFQSAGVPGWRLGTDDNSLSNGRH
jgi:hypothetical protein